MHNSFVYLFFCLSGTILLSQLNNPVSIKLSREMYFFYFLFLQFFSQEAEPIKNGKKANSTISLGNNQFISCNNIREECLTNIFEFSSYFNLTIPNIKKKKLLILSDAPIKYIDADIYKYFTSLIELSMFDFHFLQFISHRPVINSKLLKRVIFRNVSKLFLDVESFEAMPSIESLQIYGSHIFELNNENIFLYNPHLKYVTIEYSSVYRINSELFYNQNYLEYLSLRGNPIGYSKITCILSHRFLKNLDLSETNMNYITFQLLACLPELRILDISNNKIKKINYFSFFFNNFIEDIIFTNRVEIEKSIGKMYCKFSNFFDILHNMELQTTTTTTEWTDIQDVEIMNN